MASQTRIWDACGLSGHKSLFKHLAKQTNDRYEPRNVGVLWPYNDVVGAINDEKYLPVLKKIQSGELPADTPEAEGMLYFPGLIDEMRAAGINLGRVHHLKGFTRQGENGQEEHEEFYWCANERHTLGSSQPSIRQAIHDEQIDILLLFDPYERGEKYLPQLLDRCKKLKVVVVHDWFTWNLCTPGMQYIMLGLDEEELIEEGLQWRNGIYPRESNDNGPRPVTRSADEFAARTDIPARDPVLLGPDGLPVYIKRSLNQLFAWRGTGKTMALYALGAAIASGGKFLRWTAPKPQTVLYIDGELPAKEIQERIHLHGHPLNLHILDRDSQPNGRIPSIATPEGRTWLQMAIDDIRPDVLILDSLSSLANISANEEENWLELTDWFMSELRSKRGLCTIFANQAGKGGLQRGHSKSEDPLDTSAKLTRDPEAGDQEVKFSIEFDKVRGQRGDGFAAVEVEFKDREWSHQLRTDSMTAKIKDMAAQYPNWGPSKIAKELGCAKSLVSKVAPGCGRKHDDGEDWGKQRAAGRD
jgi:hypothetical protein